METDKKLLRQEMRCIRNSLTKEEIAVKSQRIFKKICSNNVYKESEYIFSYVSFRNEVDTTWFHEKVFEDNKVLLLPKVLTKEKMEFYKVSDLDDLECSPMGIFEPKDTCKLFKIDQTPGLMILPGLAYDFSGARLGYGGGYYDRYLEEIQHNGDSFYISLLQNLFRIEFSKKIFNGFISFNDKKNDVRPI